MQVSKRTVRFFISYAHADRKLKDELLKAARQPWLDTANDYSFVLWQDRDIIAGKQWHEAIQTAVKACDFGLLLVSPQFLASDYITKQELRHFVASDPMAAPPGKPAVPVALRTLRYRRQDRHEGSGAAPDFSGQAGQSVPGTRHRQNAERLRQ